MLFQFRAKSSAHSRTRKKRARIYYPNKRGTSHDRQKRENPSRHNLDLQLMLTVAVPPVENPTHWTSKRWTTAWGKVAPKTVAPAASTLPQTHTSSASIPKGAESINKCFRIAYR
jgi:hypothetical protein